MATVAARATLDDLMRTEGRAELIKGEVVQLMASGFDPSLVGFNISIELRAYAKSIGRGYAFPDGMGFAVPVLSSGRESFQPDASYYPGSPPIQRMRFISGVPLLAVEVRSENDYGRFAELEMADKRADYFEAGTKVVWDVDPITQEIRKYTADAPESPTIFASGESADAEPALPGWRMEVDVAFTI